MWREVDHQILFFGPPYVNETHHSRLSFSDESVSDHYSNMTENIHSYFFLSYYVM